tara:strand:+ start:3001 stop:3282 length:282 start_codon:yes stop_codon:yes gene_type:complete
MSKAILVTIIRGDECTVSSFFVDDTVFPSILIPYLGKTITSEGLVKKHDGYYCDFRTGVDPLVVEAAWGLMIYNSKKSWNGSVNSEHFQFLIV